MLKQLCIAGSLLLALPALALEVSSPDIKEGHFMAKTFEFSGFGCGGDNKSPALNWKDLPAGTKSIAVTVYDPDAPTGSGWWHWLVADIAVENTGLAQGAGNAGGKMPAGSRSFNNDYGIKDFGGACPPVGHGMHRYQFTVWALPDVKLPVPDNANAAVVGYTLNAKALAKKTLTATYAR
ncbi:YbhB/YbcL family Raf kinase inhibitor-like protein [Rheinheimera sp.]|uniref:YbhB/YbcL family Raf kinase inhibitor-like protein n=1 Tax=Rheinheimera sp. TaxID=1869214 RepID=UPI002FDECDB1